MKKIFVLATLLALTIGEEIDLSAQEHKKRGVSAKPPVVNSLNGNGHQKPDAISYSAYQQQLPATQAPLYPLAPPSYVDQTHQQQPQVQHQQQHQAAFSFLPHSPQQIQVLAQPQPKIQIFASKGANGQTTHLMLLPQSLFFNPYQFQSPSFQNFHQPQAVPQVPRPAASTQSSFAINQPSPLFAPPPAVYPQHASPFNFAPSPIAGHPMLYFGQPNAPLFNNYAPQQQHSSLLYSPVGQQLLNYFQTNPQAKNQLLYGSPTYQPGHQLQTLEYEKNVQATVPQSTKSESEANLNTNEYVTSESQFRPIPSYGSRAQRSYRS